MPQRATAPQAMTRQLALSGGLAMLGVVLEENELNPEYSLAIASISATLLTLSYGRDAELEADRVGLITMARAGYDPRVAVEFWQRMEPYGTEAPPEWLSTHPSHGHRIEQIRSLLPEALAIWESTQGRGGSPTESDF
jgi:metalloendopeptidase OMA1, mitochondrial